MAIDLGRGEADTGRFVHGFEHVADQLPQLVVELGDRFGDRAQARIREMQNI